MDQLKEMQEQWEIIKDTLRREYDLSDISYKRIFLESQGNHGLHKQEPDELSDE